MNNPGNRLPPSFAGLRTRRPTGKRRAHLLGGAAGFVAVAVVGAVAVAGCTSGTASEQRTVTEPATVSQASFVEVRRAPGCGCCGGWEAYMRDQGFVVEGAADPDIAQFKASKGVPASAQACHTALIDGYVIEGHVPIEAITDLLKERPAIDGIALAGMPAGSPGMSGQQQAPFEVLALSDGTAIGFGEY